MLKISLITKYYFVLILTLAGLVAGLSVIKLLAQPDYNDVGVVLPGQEIE